MRRFAWKLCFAMLSVWLLMVGAALAAAPADSAQGGSTVEESQAIEAAPALPATPEASTPEAAYQVKEETFDVSPQVLKGVSQGYEIVPMDSAGVPRASGAPPRTSGSAPRVSGAPRAYEVVPESGVSGAAAEETVKPGPTPAPATSKDGFFVKFNNANLYEVIHMLAGNAGINYMIDPRVKGVVNVHTQGMLQKSSALELLFTILRVNGATAVKEGNTYHILPMTEARMEPLTPSITGDNNAVRGVPGQVNMRVYPLHYISVTEMATTVKPLLSPAGETVEVPRANTLLVVDTEANLDKIARLVEILDSDVFRSAGVKMFKLEKMDPEEMVKNLETIFKALDFSASGQKPSGINFVPVSKLSSILVVSASSKVLADVGKWIEELDKPGGSSSRSVHRYRIKFGKVADISAILSQLYPSNAALAEGARKTEFRTSISQPMGQQSYDPYSQSDSAFQNTTSSFRQGSSSTFSSQPIRQTATSSSASSSSSLSAAAAARNRRSRPPGEEEEKPFDIIPDEATNSLIVRATLAEYTELLGILKTVDVYPQQVLLEVLVGEVNLSDDMKLGISWQWSGRTVDGGRDISHTLTMSESGFANNFNYFVEKTNRLTGLFKSLAEDGKASILSSPSVIAANGKTSTINVVDQIPITTSILNSATNPPVTTTSVEYRDVGVILNFTPFINEDGLVTMEIEQEVSDVSVGSVAPGTNPSFFKRSISTNLVASQDQSIVLGGLVKEKKSLDRSGLPFIYKIPVIGWLFGAREDSVVRNELLIFITPRVIRSVEEGVNLSREFEDRVSELKARIVESKGIRGN